MKKLCVSITGGGTQWVGDYLSKGGRSDHFVEAVVPYSQAALDAYLGKAPDKYCAVETASQMAMRAFERCRNLCPCDSISNMAGIGVTASLFKEKQREGRLNVAYLAYQDIEVSRAYTVYLKGKSRQEQEVELATYINDLATNYRLDNWDIFAWYCPNTYTDVYSGKTPFKLSRQGIHPHQAVEPSIIFSSSCNPFHHGHGAMVQYCRQKHSKSMVFCELSIKNFEKPTVDYISLHKRLESIPPIFDDVIVSSLPDFVSKSVYYPNCYFAVGVDTINRIDWLKDRDRFEQNKVKFLVFPRAGHDMKDKRMLYDPLILFAYDFEPLAVSSTEIRAANK